MTGFHRTLGETLKHSREMTSERLFGSITLTRHAGRRNTVLVDSQAITGVGNNRLTAGFTVAMPDNTELSIRLDRTAIEALARALKIGEART